MKRLLLFVIPLLLCTKAVATPLESNGLEEKFGAVRVELVRQIGDIAAITDSVVLKTIDDTVQVAFNTIFLECCAKEPKVSKEQKAQKVKLPTFSKKKVAACGSIVLIIALVLFCLHRRFSKKKSPAPKTEVQQPVVLPAVKEEAASCKPVEEVDLSKVRVSFAEQDNDRTVVGTSVVGLSHIQMNLPCQDFCGYEKLENGWGIAITSDGAGSAEHSDIGSKVVVERGMIHFKQKLATKTWIADNTLPTDAEWTQFAYNALKAVYDDMKMVADKNNKPLSSFAATVIVLIHTPKGILVSHIGDGRAGYADANNCWKSLIVPHKGEEANQTIFITSDFWNIPNYVMSGVFVPECRVIREVPSAFALMSDGCENTCWLCNRFDETTRKFGDPNEPYDKFFSSICDSIVSMKESNDPLDEMKTKWATYLLTVGKFAKEPDDKTMIVGKLFYR